MGSMVFVRIRLTCFLLSTLRGQLPQAEIIGKGKLYPRFPDKLYDKVVLGTWWLGLRVFRGNPRLSELT